MARARWVVSLGTVVTLVLAACSTREPPSGATPPTETGPSTTTTTAATVVPAPAPLDWHDCDGLECSTLTVPLDYDDPAAGTVDLAVARRVTTGRDPVGSVVVNPGGPGGSGLAYLRNGGGSTLARHFDVVSWDPRGAGASRPLRCADDGTFFTLDPSPDDDAERSALEGAARRIASACAAADRDLLRTLTTDTAARDLEQLRRALGDEPLTYLGFSYGTHIGLRYAQRFPDRVRAMALDGVVDPRESTTEFLTGQAVEMQRLLAPDLEAYRRVAARVEAEPLPSRTGDPVGPGLLGVAAFASVYGTDGARRLTAALDDALQGDGTALAGLAATYVGSSSFAAYLGVLCVDAARPTDVDDWWQFVADISRAAPDLGASVGNELLPCAFWGEPPTTARPPTSWAQDLPPILLVASTRDAATPLDDAQRVHADLPHSVLLVREGPGHTSFGASGCVRAAVVTYLADRTPPDEGTICSS